MSRIAFFILTFFAFSALADSGIWPGRNDWNEQWEAKYSSWVEEQAKDTDFFKSRNIRIDCVDVVYGFRWIFSRINDLKAFATTNNESVMTNRTDNPIWSNLPTDSDWQHDRRFLAALNYMMDQVSTFTIDRDSYPVAITAEALQPGTFYLIPQHHSQLIAEAHPGQTDVMPLQFVQGTVPRQIQTTTRLGYWDGDAPISTKAGFRRFLWPHTAAQKMPFYSLQQFKAYATFNPNVEDSTFTTFVYLTLSPDLDLKKVISTGLTQLVERYRDRQKIVEEGYNHCSHEPKGCVDGTQDFDDYSTPSRDKQIEDLISQVATDVGNARHLPGEPHLIWNDFMNNTVVFQMEGHSLTLLNLYSIWREKYFSSNPNDSIERRWGLDRFYSPTAAH